MTILKCVFITRNYFKFHCITATDLTCEDKSARKIGADDFLPLLVYSIMKCKFTAADIEAQYIDGE